MKERPIPFNGPIAGTKTQTRRKVKGVVEQGGAYSLDAHMQGNFPLCPYGVPGDRLWVKETFAVVEGGDPLVTFCSDGRTIMMDDRADYGFGTLPLRWTPSIYMPRWASRLTLEVTEVRVERLQEISEVDALAEGVTHGQSARDAFASLWEKIHGEGSWGMDPWVWVVGFKRVTAP